MFALTFVPPQATKQHLESTIQRLTTAAEDSRREVVSLQATNLQLSLSAQSSDANADAFRKQLDGLRANNQACERMDFRECAVLAYLALVCQELLNNLCLAEEREADAQVSGATAIDIVLPA